MRAIIRSAALVEAWFDNLAPEQQATARALRSAVLDADPSLTQVIKWGNLMFLLGGVHALAIICHRDHANLQIFNGAQLLARFPVLDGTGKNLRHLRCRYSQAVDAELVADLTQACVDGLGAAAR
jgi:hypothetical protein